MAKALSRALGATLVTSTVSRLLIDLNRSPGHPDLFSEVTSAAPTAVRDAILRRYYVPYREAVERCVRAATAQGRRVIHVSSHSFTPKRNSRVRNADVGLLYDPKRAGERALCARWKLSLGKRAPLKVRRNYPYKGVSDGVTSYLRKHYPDTRYVGIELELNQRYSRRAPAQWLWLRRAVIDALEDALTANRPRNSNMR